MPTITNYPDPREAADSVAPGSTSYRPDNASGSQPYYVSGDPDSIEQYCRSLLGYNQSPTPIDGTIRRNLPRRHPKYQAMFATQIDEVGYGRPSLEDSVPAYLTGADPIVEKVGVYPDSTITVRFEQLKYDCLHDDVISVENATWVDPDGNARDAKYATEWLRFTQWTKKFTPQIMTATQGSLRWYVNSGSDLNLTEFPGSPRIDYPEFELTCLWTAVPYRYVWSTRSYLDRLANTVNQLECTLENYFFNPGELLYLGYTYTDYRPTWPKGAALLGAPGILVSEKLVNVELRFQVARREATDAPILANPNWIPHGHNVLPSFFDRKFHYVGGFKPSAPNDQNYWYPLFLSSMQPMWLFTDPDLLQPDEDGGYGLWGSAP